MNLKSQVSLTAMLEQYQGVIAQFHLRLFGGHVVLLCVFFSTTLDLSQESLGLRAKKLEDGRVFLGFCGFFWRLSVVGHGLATVTNAAGEALSGARSSSFR